jgi:predicted phage terminase large subunit-like protein
MARDRNGETRIEDCVGTRDGPTEVEELMLRTAKDDGKATLIAFFQDPAQAGKSQAQRLRLHFASLGYEVVVLPSSTGKQTYAKPLAIAAKSGKVSIVAGSWRAEFVGEHHMFLCGKHDDMVDAGSAAFTVLEQRAPNVANIIIPKQPTQSIYRPRKYA